MLLSAFTENGVCLLTSAQKRSYSFTGGSYGRQTIPGVLQYIREKEKDLQQLDLIHKVKQEEIKRLICLRNLTVVKIQKKLRKKRIRKFALFGKRRN